MSACHSQREPWQTAAKRPPSCQASRLLDRVAAARTARQANRSTMLLPLAPGSHVSAHMVVCPRAARATFAQDGAALSKGSRGGPCLALTAVNGDAWRAQRPLVANALGGAPSRTSRAAAVAVVAAMMGEIRGTVDAREIFLRVGTACVVAAMVGRRDATLEGAVAAIFAPSLARARYRATPAEGERVDSALRAAGGGGLLEALRQECAADVALDNAHRALLAGAQTIAATLCAALAFIAAHPSQSLDARAAVRETLRILPPVATLPRRVETRVDVGGGVARGAWVVGDLVACAHGDDAASLRYDPARQADGDAAPWGLGPRVCPAGQLSTACVAAALEALAARATWRLARPARDGVGSDGTCGFLEPLVYARTLAFPRHVPLVVQLRPPRPPECKTVTYFACACGRKRI
jgi:cytochrome P450